MSFNNQNPNPSITVTFDGLNTHVNELLLKGRTSPDLLNVDLDPISVANKRSGIEVLAGLVVGTGKCDMFRVLYKMSEKRGVAYSFNGNIISASALSGLTGNWSNVFSAWEDVEMPGTERAYYTDENGNADIPTGFVFKAEALYVTSSDNEPMLLLGDVTAPVSSNAVTSIETDSSSVKITSTGHTFTEGDLVRVSGITDTDWLVLNDRTFIIEDIVAGTSFYLRDGNLDRVASSFSLSSTGVGTVSVQASSSDQCRRWPRGKYSTTTPVRGYPERWIDPNDTAAGATWPTGPKDWPSHTTYFGHGLGARLFAYGFRTDPDRIDYSQLGVPYNFLKADQAGDAADGNTAEANAPSSPSVDGGLFYAARGDGDRVVAVRELMGFVVVFKTNKTLLFTGEIGEFFRVAKEYPVGTINDESVIRVGNDLYFWSFDGPRRLSSTDQAADLLQGAAGEDVIEITRTLASGAMKRVVARHERTKQRIVWHFPSGSAVENDKCLVYYYPSKVDQDGRWSLFDGKYAEMTDTYQHEDPVLNTVATYGASNSTGRIYSMNTGSNDGNVDEDADPLVPEVINFRYITKWFSVDEPTIYKKALELLTLYTGEGQAEAKIYIAWDYSDDWQEFNVTIDAGGSADGLWNYGFWGGVSTEYPSGFGAGVWNSSGKALVTYEAYGRGRIFRFKIEDSSVYPCGFSGLILRLSRKGPR